MITLHFNVLDKNANTVKHGVCKELPNTCRRFQFYFERNSQVVYSCRDFLDDFVRRQVEQGFLVSFAPTKYFFLDE